MALVDQPDAQRFDEGGLARTGNARDAQPNGSAGVRQQLGDYLLSALLVVDARRFDQGDGLGQRAALAGQDAVDQELVVSR